MVKLKEISQKKFKGGREDQFLNLLPLMTFQEQLQAQKEKELSATMKEKK
jgi:hypothetical protein